MKQFLVWVDNASFLAGLSQRYYSTIIWVIYILFFLLTFHQHPHRFYFPFYTDASQSLVVGNKLITVHVQQSEEAQLRAALNTHASVSSWTIIGPASSDLYFISAEDYAHGK